VNESAKYPPCRSRKEGIGPDHIRPSSARCSLLGCGARFDEELTLFVSARLAVEDLCGSRVHSTGGRAAEGVGAVVPF